MFAEREFRALWFSQAVSVTGDRLALVALALLVYQRTGSALLTAAAYAAGFVPWVAGGLVLARLADRLPRRGVMAGCDVIRAGLVAVMTLPGEPVAALVILLFAATSLAPLFEAARAAITPEILGMHAAGPVGPAGSRVNAPGCALSATRAALPAPTGPGRAIRSSPIRRP